MLDLDFFKKHKKSTLSKFAGKFNPNKNFESHFDKRLKEILKLETDLSNDIIHTFKNIKKSIENFYFHSFLELNDQKLFGGLQETEKSEIRHQMTDKLKQFYEFIKSIINEGSYQNTSSVDDKDLQEGLSWIQNKLIEGREHRTPDEEEKIYEFTKSLETAYPPLITHLTAH
jgi:hypothetical protein